MLLTVDHTFINIAVGIPGRRIKQSQFKTGNKEGGQTLINGGFSYQSPVHGFLQSRKRISAIQTHTHVKCHGCRFGHITGHHMTGMKILDGPAVTQKMPLKTPCVHENILVKQLAGTGRFPQNPVVGSHNRFNIGFCDQCLKSRKISFMQIFQAGNGIKFMPQGLRAGMYGIMFCTGTRFQVLGMITLQAFNHFHTQLGC